MAKEVSKSNKEKKSKNDKKENKNFFKEFKAELKRVSWPTFKQLVNNTAAVIAIVLILVIIVFILDVIFENANKFGVEKLKALVTSSSSETVDGEEQPLEDDGHNHNHEAEEGTVETNDGENTNEPETTNEIDENSNSVEN